KVHLFPAVCLVLAEKLAKVQAFLLFKHFYAVYDQIDAQTQQFGVPTHITSEKDAQTQQFAICFHNTHGVCALTKKQTPTQTPYQNKLQHKLHIKTNSMPMQMEPFPHRRKDST
ncbi:hypothetical protein G8C92_06065, partial [Paenibacillus donghaensis]|uniref:hypothetical protein n=1 Tax=Paenibacillus donghaensis TaxID=414771 RepID=UPI001883E702